MKLTPLVLWTLLLLPIAAFADDFSLTDGREYKDVTVTRVEQDGIVVMSNDGVEKLPFSLLSKEVQLAYPYKGPSTPTPNPTPDMDAQIMALEKHDAEAAAKATPTPDLSGSTAQAAEAAARKGHYGRLCELLAAGVVAFFVLCTTLLVGSCFAKRLIKFCALRQKQREFDTANTQQFQAAYMDFFAIWKLWNHYIEQHGESELPDHGEYEIPHATRWELLTRAYIAEGSVDAVFLKISSARKLTPGAIELLGRFRQAFHALGLAIKNNKPLGWKDAEHPDYLVFKRLASGVAVLISGEDLGAQAADMRSDSFRQITLRSLGTLMEFGEFPPIHRHKVAAPVLRSPVNFLPPRRDVCYFTCNNDHHVNYSDH